MASYLGTWQKPAEFTNRVCPVPSPESNMPILAIAGTAATRKITMNGESSDFPYGSQNHLGFLACWFRRRFENAHRACRPIQHALCWRALIEN